MKDLLPLFKIVLQIQTKRWGNICVAWLVWSQSYSFSIASTRACNADTMTSLSGPECECSPSLKSKSTATLCMQYFKLWQYLAKLSFLCSLSMVWRNVQYFVMKSAEVTQTDSTHSTCQSTARLVSFRIVSTLLSIKQIRGRFWVSLNKF